MYRALKSNELLSFHFQIYCFFCCCCCFTQIVLNKVAGEECFVIYILKMYTCVYVCMYAYWHICGYNIMNVDAHEHICMCIWTPKVELGSSVTFHLTH